jgi:phosphate transport system permease protein
VVFAVPVGVGAAIYLVEFAKPSRFNEFVQTNINNLAGVPSIVYGMLGLAILVRVLEPITSGDIFTGGASPSDSGRTILSAGITLGLLTLPVVIISSQEALKAVPDSLRQAGMALGATKWQTVRSQILPIAMPGVLTGTILAVGRAVGETAPLILVGAASFITIDPSGPFSKFTALPIQIFQWTSFPQEEFRNLAAAASIALLLLLLTLNAAAVILRNRFSRRVE